MTAEIAGAAAPPEAKASAADAAARSSWPPARVAYYTLFVLILSTTCSQLDIAIVPYLGPYIKGDLHLSDYDFSLMVGLSFGLFYTAVGSPIRILNLSWTLVDLSMAPRMSWQVERKRRSSTSSRP